MEKGLQKKRNKLYAYFTKIMETGCRGECWNEKLYKDGESV